MKSKLKNEKSTRCCSKLFIANINTSAIHHDDTRVNSEWLHGKWTALIYESLLPIKSSGYIQTFSSESSDLSPVQFRTSGIRSTDTQNDGGGEGEVLLLRVIFPGTISCRRFYREE